jgi:hypothetical protein
MLFMKHGQYVIYVARGDLTFKTSAGRDTSWDAYVRHVAMRVRVAAIPVRFNANEQQCRRMAAATSFHVRKHNCTHSDSRRFAHMVGA